MSMLPITYRTAVLPAWVDYNGHLRDAYSVSYTHLTLPTTPYV